jgi:hypothetical protein
MKKLNLLVNVFACFAGIAIPLFTRAQCDCNQPDPQGYCNYSDKTIGQIGSSCGLGTNITISGSNSTCLASSCSSTSMYYEYQVYFPANEVTGYEYAVTGGIVSQEIVNYGNGKQPETFQPCSSLGEKGSINFINSATFRINWTSAGSSNCFVIWGYTGYTGTYPTTLAYFKVLSVGTSDGVPAAPTGISISSPTSYPICGWKVASSSVWNASQYIWSGAVSATSNDIVGPAVGENQIVSLYVHTTNYCGTSSDYHSFVSIPNNPGCGLTKKVLSKEPGKGLADLNSTEENKIQVSPNPASKWLTINGINSETLYVDLISATGNITRMLIPTGQNKIEIDVSNLARGLYILAIRQAGGKSINKKVMLH